MPIYRRKGIVGQQHPLINSVRYGYTAAKNNQGCHRTDYNSIQKHLHDSHQSLFHRICYIGIGMGNSCCTHSGLIGKHPPGHPGAQSNKYRPYQAPSNGLGSKGSMENSSKSLGYSVTAQYQNPKGKKNVPCGSKGHQLFRRGSHLPCTTHKHQGN